MIDSKNLTYSDAALVLSRELIPGSNFSILTLPHLFLQKVPVFLCLTII
ncbi:MAG: hypothetical protein ABI417_04580 [Coleofasciculaceae cyanobacterium]